MQLVLSDPKTGKAYSKKIESPALFLNKKIGEEIKLDSVGLEGYTAKIKGGSDKQGFPMNQSIQGSIRKKIFTGKTTGFRPKRKGERTRKSVRGNIISSEIEQVNLTVTTYGSKPLSEILGKEPKVEEKKESVKEQMIKESLETVGKEGLAEEAKKVKGKVKR
ncbi:MAG: 30S ribosomal protein S6e [Candidatus Diapherotrites archaeon]